MKKTKEEIDADAQQMADIVIACVDEAKEVICKHGDGMGNGLQAIGVMIVAATDIFASMMEACVEYDRKHPGAGLCNKALETYATMAMPSVQRAMGMGGGEEDESQSVH